jgi:hypothetical protein
LDVLTPYGTQIFYPISLKKYSIDLLHSFDPIFMVISSSIILYGLLKLKPKRKLDKFAILAFSSAYLLYCGIAISGKLCHSREYKNLFRARIPHSEYIRTIPRTFWRWKGIFKTEKHFWVVSKTSNVLNLKSHERNVRLPIVVRKDKDVVTFLNYARYPVVSCSQNRIHIYNLVYSPDSYCLTLWTDSNNKILKRQITGFDLLDKKL